MRIDDVIHRPHRLKSMAENENMLKHVRAIRLTRFNEFDIAVAQLGDNVAEKRRCRPAILALKP
jgi:hypothetical protein